jgi:hypothetical protein
MWLFTMVAWVEGFPERAPTNPHNAQILTLAWSLPAPLAAWAAPFHERADVKALG